jgi:predicted transcriptional regulator
MYPQSREYSKKRIARLVKKFGSISKTARAGNLSPATLSKYISGKRTKLSNITCAALDDLYNETF